MASDRLYDVPSAEDVHNTNLLCFVRVAFALRISLVQNSIADTYERWLRDWWKAAAFMPFRNAQNIVHVDRGKDSMVVAWETQQQRGVGSKC